MNLFLNFAGELSWETPNLNTVNQPHNHNNPLIGLIYSRVSKLTPIQLKLQSNCDFIFAHEQLIQYNGLTAILYNNPVTACI